MLVDWAQVEASSQLGIYGLSGFSFTVHFIIQQNVR